MVEDGRAPDSVAAPAIKRLLAAGYVGADSCTLKLVHCGQEKFSWMANGFLQCFLDMDTAKGKVKARVLDYAPRQCLQPHCHDADELFRITGGRVKVFSWPRDNGAATARWLGPGDDLAIPAHTPHALYADPTQGVQFHEIVGDFQKRATHFYHTDDHGTEPKAGFAVCSDGALRHQPARLRGRFGDKNVFVTGCSRGLGLELALQFAVAGANVVASCRNPGRALELQAAMQWAGRRGSVVACDLDSEKSIAAATEQVKQTFGSVDVLFNNAGISNPDHPIDPILSAKAVDIANVFKTNVIGTVIVTQHMLPLLRAGGCKMLVNISSELASIKGAFGVQGRYGGVSSYRMSRAANNMALRTFAGELHGEGFTCVALSPGWAATDMGSKGGRSPPLTPQQSVGGMLKTLSALSPADNGRYLQYNGSELSW